MTKAQPKADDLGLLAARLLALYDSNKRSVGRFDVRNGKVHTVYHPPTVVDWHDHLLGKEGIGCVPIHDDDTCKWAALDIDNHGSEDDTPIAPVDEKVRASKLPLILCRSKSGGIHAYVFFDKPQPAGRVRAVLARWAEMIGFAGCEVFPKQSKLANNSRDGGKALGNWINMPYLGADEGVRYAFRDGKKLLLRDFIDTAERVKCTDTDLDQSILFDHPHAPPCIQQLLLKGAPSGQRNEALFNVTIYLRRAFPDGFEDRARDLNGAIFDKPLPRAELARTVSSAGRPDYSYRCGEEPVRSLCDRDTCIKRKFGINKDEYDALSAAQSLPLFAALTKYCSEPVRWEMSIDDVRVSNIPTEILLDWSAMRKLAAEKLTKIFPLIKNQEWERILSPLMKEARIVDAPDDASVAGIIRARLREFAGKADLMSTGEIVADRKAMLRGLPCVQVYQGERVVMFRAQDFVNFLKRAKAESLTGVNLWFAVKDIGVGHTKLRAGEYNINVWYVPLDEVMKDNPEPSKPEFKAKL